MKRGERLEITRKVAAELAGLRDYIEIDHTLNTFGIDTPNQWGNDAYSYVLLTLGSADDADLLELYEHLFQNGGVDPATPPAELPIPDFWEADHFRLFISHITRNKVFAAELKAELSKFGIGGFCAHEDIAVSREWQDEIEKALHSCEALVADLLPATVDSEGNAVTGFKESPWCDQEVGFAYGRGVLIVALRRPGIDPYGFMSPNQALTCGSKAPSEIAAELYHTLLKNPKTAARMAEIVLSNFERSPTWEDAKRRAPFLRDIPTWTPEMLDRLAASPDRNEKIAEAYSPVPYTLRGILTDNGRTPPPPPWPKRPPPPPTRPAVAPAPWDVDDEDLPF